MKILVVFPEQELAQAQIIDMKISEALEGQTSVDLAKNQKDAFGLCYSKDYSLIIVAVNIPKTSELPLNPEEKLGLSFLSTLNDQGYKKPSIIVIDILDTDTYSRIQKLNSCMALLRGTEDWEVALIARVRQQLGLLDFNPRKHCRVDIGLDLENKRGDYRINGNFLPEFSGFLERVDFRRIRYLVDQSRAIGRIEDKLWIDLFRNVGEELLKELFENNYCFTRDFNRTAASLVSDVESVRIRFIVSAGAHPLACEALVADDRSYWMLRSPVYRKINAVSPVAFVEDQNEATEIVLRRCLIVIADTKGMVKGLAAGLPELLLDKLPQIEGEGDQLENYLRSKGVYVSRLGGLGRDRPSRERLTKALESGNWDVVHFAGHSFWDEQEKAVIFLPGENGPEPLPIESLAVLLRKARTRLVYLSSCSSSGCAVELAEKRISSIIGYRWEVDDELAVEHAKLFYENIFEYQKSLEIAFLRTRQQMHERYPQDRIWASAVLVKQGEID